MEPIRILHVLGKLNRGGAETLVMNWYRNIDRTKIQFDFVIHTKEHCAYTDEVLQLGGKIYSVPAYRGKNHAAYCRAWNQLFEQHPEYKIVHGHVRSTAVLYLTIAKKFGCVAISHSHSVNSGNGISAVVKSLMQYPIRYCADYFWACSQDAGKFLFGKKACCSNRFRVVYNAIEAEKFSFNRETRVKYREKLELHGKFVLGHVGRFIPEKNHEFLLQVLKELKKQCPEATLLMVGDGPLCHEVMGKVADLGLENDVLLLQDRADVPEIMQAMDIFLFPSVFEGLGIAAIEAQAAGLSCLVSDRVPTEVSLTDHICFLPVDDPKIWAEAAEQSLKKTYDRRNEYETIARAGYDAKTSAQLLQADYLELLKERSL